MRLEINYTISITKIDYLIKLIFAECSIFTLWVRGRGRPGDEAS